MKAIICVLLLKRVKYVVNKKQDTRNKGTNNIQFSNNQYSNNLIF